MIPFAEHFPENYTPTTEQSQVLDQLTHAFEKHKFVICCAPTGSGKSFISKTIANASLKPTSEFVRLIESYDAFKTEAGSYIYEDECLAEPAFGAAALTITKQLQDQYQQLFQDTKVIKGKSNYMCAIDSNFSVDVAPCTYMPKLKQDCWRNNACPYYTARNQALTNKFAAFNYSMYMALPHHVKRKQYLICDEAAELEDELVKHFSVEVNAKTLKFLLPKFNNFVDVDNAIKVKQYLGELSTLLHELCEELKSKVAKKASAIEISKLQQARNLKEQINTAVENWCNAEYICEKTKTGIIVQPLKVDKLSNALFRNADKVLLMSATIIDPENYAKSLGITDYEYIELPSAFDASKAPIYCMSKYKMNRDNWLKLMPTFKQIIDQICEQHKDHKGIIHTHNMDITNYMRENLKGNRFLFREDGVDNQSILDMHMQSPYNTVLVSPSMTHGVDLKDDLARFQVIVKAPFLPLNSKRIMKLFKADAQWYANKMLTTVIQASGRGVRTKDDHCATYILDGCIVSSILDNANKMPKYFLKRFQ